MTTYYEDATVQLHHGDCLDVLRSLPDNSVDAVVTDPPAGIGFMGRGWDHNKGGRDQWSAWLAEVMRECYRVAKPGAHAFVWALPRTSHWTACGIEDAGWEIRDRVVHLFGTGFPKSHNLPGGLGTALKPAAEDWWLARKPLTGTVAANVLAWGTGALNIDGCRVEHDEPEGKPSTGMHGRRAGIMGETIERHRETTAASTAGRWPANVVLDSESAAELDQQSGESVSPPVGSVARTQGGDTIGTFAHQGRPPSPNGHGDQGGASRFFYVAKADASERPFIFRPTCECEDAWPTPSAARATAATTSPESLSTSKHGNVTTVDPSQMATRSTTSTATSSTTTTTTSSQSPPPTTSASTPGANSETASGGSHAASVASSSASAPVTGTSAAKGGRSTADAVRAISRGWSATSVCGNCGAPSRREAHATVKPLALMRWLVRLVTPPGGTVLEPFAGSGTTVEACILEGFHCVAIEREADYLPLIVQRINRRRDPVAAVIAQGDDAGLFDLLDVDPEGKSLTTFVTRKRPASPDLGFMNDDGWQPKPITQRRYRDGG